MLQVSKFGCTLLNDDAALSILNPRSPGGWGIFRWLELGNWEVGPPYHAMQKQYWLIDYSILGVLLLFSWSPQTWTLDIQPCSTESISWQYAGRLFCRFAWTMICMDHAVEIQSSFHSFTHPLLFFCFQPIGNGIDLLARLGRSGQSAPTA